VTPEEARRYQEYTHAVWLDVGKYPDSNRVAKLVRGLLTIITPETAAFVALVVSCATANLPLAVSSVRVMCFLLGQRAAIGLIMCFDQSFARAIVHLNPNGWELTGMGVYGVCSLSARIGRWGLDMSRAAIGGIARGVVRGRDLESGGYKYGYAWGQIVRTSGTFGDSRSRCGLNAINWGLMENGEPPLGLREVARATSRKDCYGDDDLHTMARLAGRRLCILSGPDSPYNAVVYPGEGELLYVHNDPPRPAENYAGHWSAIAMGEFRVSAAFTAPVRTPGPRPGENTIFGAGMNERNMVKSESSLAIGLSTELEKRGITGESKDWVAKALYPPGSGGHLGLPGGGAADTISMDYTLTSTIQAPGAVKWDCLIVSPPHDGSPVIIATAPSPADFGATSAPVGYGYTTIDPYGGVQARTNIPVTVREVSTSSAPTYVCLQRMPAHLPRGVRHLYKSTTVDMVASDLYNGGTVISGQVPVTAVSDTVAFQLDTLVGVISAGQSIACEVGFEVPVDEATLTRAVSDTVYAAAAKDGCYMPLKLDVSSAMRFDPGLYANGRGKIYAGASLTSQYWIDRRDNTNSDYLVTYPVFLGYGASGVTKPWWGNDQNSWTWLRQRPGLSTSAQTLTGVQIYRGLDPNASLLCTLRLGLECTLLPTSPLITQLSSPVAPDPRALAAYYEIAMKQKDAFPAADNLLGLALPGIMAALRAAVPVVKEWGPKVLSAVAPGAIDAIGSILSPKASEPAAVVKAVARRKREPVAKARREVATVAQAERAVSRRRASSAASRVSSVRSAARRKVTRFRRN